MTSWSLKDKRKHAGIIAKERGSDNNIIRDQSNKYWRLSQETSSKNGELKEEGSTITTSPFTGKS